MSDTTIPSLRRCTKCGVEYPATLEYFHKHSSDTGKLRSRCKSCVKDANRDWRRRNPLLVKEKERRRCTEKRQEKRREWDRKRHLRAGDEIRARVRKWKEDNPQRRRVTHQRREARKRSLPNTLTHEQWQRAVEYFHGCCAACGRQANDLFSTHTLAMDHWIPLNSPNCPGTTALNCIPLCHGEGGCNNSKHDRLPEEWLVHKFGKRKAIEILKRIKDYFDSLT
jgi:hypothetical protein